MAVDQEARDLINSILAEFATRWDGGTWGVPADFSVLVRQNQPPASGASQFKGEDVPVAQNSFLGRLTGDIVDRTFAEVLSDIGAAAASHTHTEGDITDLDHDDTDAIHDNVGSEISAITVKGTPVDADFLLIEDSAASNAKKHILIGSLPGGGGGDTHPIVDSTAIVKGSADATKLVRVEADGLTTGTTRVLTMADADIDLTPGTGSFATEAEGTLAASALQNIVEDASPQLGGTLDLNSLNRFFVDSGGNNVLLLTGVGSAVNYLRFINAPTGVGAEIQAGGSDTDVDLLLTIKGAGVVKAAGVEVVTLSATQTLTAKTLTTPTIASFANATHDHADAAGGGTLASTDLSDFTAAGTALIDDADAAAQRTTLGLGSIATATETDYLLAAGSRTLSGEWNVGPHTIGFDAQSATGDGTTTIDWKLGNKFNFLFGAQADTFTFTAPTNPCSLILKLTQDGTGGRVATWPATVKWAGGTAPTLSTGGGEVDIIAFYFDGTNYHGTASLDSS